MPFVAEIEFNRGGEGTVAGGGGEDRGISSSGLDEVGGEAEASSRHAYTGRPVKSSVIQVNMMKRVRDVT